MRLTLTRDHFNPLWTLGTLTVDGKAFGFTCEDTDRHLEVIPEAKVRRESCIPIGLYQVLFTPSQRFARSLPVLVNVPGFRGIRIHAGNSDADTEGCLLPGLFGGGIRAGGTYSKADVALILKRAAELQIEVLPEIEIPAHSFAMIKTQPGLRDPGDNGEERSVQGYLDNIVNPAMPATWALLEPLVLEIAAMFPMRALHLGCDEAPHGAWSGSPAVAALKAREGLESSDDVQGWMMARLAAKLVENGIRPAAWEEAAKGANGGIGNGALLFSWTGQGPGVEAARRGYDVVMCPAQNAYFDLAHTPDPNDWGATWAGTVSLEKTVDWDPIPKGAEDIAARVAGVQSCFWGEIVTEDGQMEPLVAPRILGIATKAWEPMGTTTGPVLRSLATLYAPLFAAMGWQHHSGA